MFLLVRNSIAAEETQRLNRYLLPQGPPLDAFNGKTVIAIEVRAEKPLEKQVVVSSVRVGEKFEPSLARRILDEILKAGLFAEGQVKVVEEAEGVRLIVEVVSRKEIAQFGVDVRGAPLGQDEIIREIGLQKGGELLEREIPNYEKQIEHLFNRRGFPFAKVSFQVRPMDGPLQVAVTVVVEAGAPRILERRTLWIFGSQSDVVQSLVDDYSVREKERADEVNLALADMSLTNQLHKKSYYQATVLHDVVLFQGVYHLRVRVDTGPHFVLRFEGNERYDVHTLTAIIAATEEVSPTPEYFLKKIKSFYTKRGYLDVGVTFEERYTLDGRQVDLVFHIKEGDVISVSKRTYPCIDFERFGQEKWKWKKSTPLSVQAVDQEIDRFLTDELPGGEPIQSPDARTVDSLTRGDQVGGVGARPVPFVSDPKSVYFPEVYEKAMHHLRELYVQDGFLQAAVGPIEIIRRRCDPHLSAEECAASTLSNGEKDLYECSEEITPDRDSSKSPRAPSACIPNSENRIHCEPSLALKIPIRLGPRTILYDVAFEGVHAFAESKLSEKAELDLGEALALSNIEEAAYRLADFYREEGYAFVEVKNSLDFSRDGTRARATFQIHEGDRVIVREIVVQGNEHTRTSVIRSRLALKVGEPYRTSAARDTQERVATLGVFSSVAVELKDPAVPAREKVVVITVVERPRRFFEWRPGFSTGEGFRLTFEYAERNVIGYAVAATSRLQLAYLPTVFILDPQVRRDFISLGDPGFDRRVVVRANQNFTIPEVGFGPFVKLSIDFIGVHDLQRQFMRDKLMLGNSLIYTPIHGLQLSFGASLEKNNASIFGAATIVDFLRQLPPSNDLQRLLRVPDGPSVAIAERFSVAWDRRDQTLNAHRGFYLFGGVEHVDSYPTDKPADNRTRFEGHFLRFMEVVSAYVPFHKRITLATQLRMGQIVQLVSEDRSKTYPDRFFFLGGADSLRGFLQDSLIPQDLVDQFDTDQCLQDSSDKRFAPCKVGMRGGNLMINPRAEVRALVLSPVELAMFVDTGNLWVNPQYVYAMKAPFRLRVTPGVGIRIQTPLGPLVLDMGFNVDRRSYEEKYAVSFSFGVL
ncbi:outer membrane protein assembly factor [Pajaroellobacter abortibovis]|uniref:POTRA domain-containing protein n=1 Tax=Pajaroellobacter abortibovis TaxID=1882918 RepID=UPI001FEB8F72|nr:outer membrane protein assembly factor [Pajaroellobacter abortibovis]